MGSAVGYAMDGFDLLILDDFGLTPLTELGKHDLLDIVDARTRSASILLAGQLPFKEWHAYIDNPMVADAVLDLTGGEGWGYETEPGTEAKPYSPDIGFKDSPDAVTGTLCGGRFVIFFPGELHRPGIAQPDCKNVHKAVVKIRMEDKYHG